MAVAYFMAHQARALVPIQNGGELAALYSFVFLFIATRGSGIWSLGGRSAASR
jgi:putative oxidoreductase